MSVTPRPGRFGRGDLKDRPTKKPSQAWKREPALLARSALSALQPWYRMHPKRAMNSEALSIGQVAHCGKSAITVVPLIARDGGLHRSRAPGRGREPAWGSCRRSHALGNDQMALEEDIYATRGPIARLARTEPFVIPTSGA